MVTLNELLRQRDELQRKTAELTTSHLVLRCPPCGYMRRYPLRAVDGWMRCPECGHPEMQQLADMPEVQIAAGIGRGRRKGQRVGAYKGAAKVGCLHMALRVRTGLSQAELAAHAGVSERTIRTWDTMSPEAFQGMREATRGAIVLALKRCGSISIDYAAELARWRGLRKPGAVRYRCPMTGSTWSGRGLMPRWLRVALDDGARLADFVADDTGSRGNSAALLKELA